MDVRDKKKSARLNFKYLPAFAEFLKREKLVDLIRAQLKYSREVKLPLLKIFQGMNEDQVIEISIPGTSELLDYFIGNNVEEYIAISQQKWVENRLPHVGKFDIVAEDINMVSYIRKKAFMVFLPEYTTIPADILAIISEIDAYVLESDTALTDTYISILQEKVNDHSHFIERITETSPGIIYVFDILQNKEVYANKMMTKLLGYTPDDWKQFGSSFVSALIHPDDIPLIQENQEAFKSIADDEVRTIQYRIKDKQGSYRWMRTHESVFKRTDDGRVWEVIGIAMSIENEKRTEYQLQKREDQLLEAQELADMGSFVWNVTTGEREATPQFYHIIDFPGGGTMEQFFAKVHPGDRATVESALNATIQNHELLNVEFHYITGSGQRVLWMKANSSTGESGDHIVKGTVMDVTQKHQIIQRLKRSEDINLKAQSLTHLGNWTWDLLTDELEWSEEMYNIYEVEPGEGVKGGYLLKYTHRDDVDRVEKILNASRRTHEPYNFYYRIITNSGKLKTLHSIGEVLVDENGIPYKMIGTLQDVTEREDLINRLQKSEALYKQAQSIARLGNWMYDVKTDLLFWTDELYRIYGLQPQDEQLNWQKYMDLVLEDDRELVNGFTTEAIRSGNSFELYHRNRSKNGAIRTLHIKGEALVNNEGEVYQLYGTAQDVTEQQRIEQELRENQNFIKKIADATPSIIASYNINTGKYRFINQGVKVLLGYTPEEVMEKGIGFFSSLIHPDDQDDLLEKNRVAIEQANSSDSDDNDLIVDFQYRMRRADGEYRWFHTYGTIFDRNADGKVDHILNISIDITERVKAEETVVEQQRFISHIAEASPTILYLFDLEHKKFLYVNKEVTEVLGYFPEEIIALGDQVYQYLHPDDTIKSPDSYIKYKQTMGTATMHQFEGRIKSRSGEWKWLLTREIVFKRNDEGKAIQVLGSALDISERKYMESSLSKKNLELEQSNANLEEFAYVASHDLQEPLRKIAIFGDRILSNYSANLEEDGQLFLSKIIESAGRMQGMINDLLSVSMLSGDKSYQLYSLDTILKDVLQTLEIKIENKKAIIKADQLPEARVIPSQFRQLFQNLISNSLKFIPPGRPPLIEITNESIPLSDLQKWNLETGRQYIKISFKDNGIGFENEFAARIFTIFQRLNGKSEYEGSGIGLAICKKIVENHQGIIFAEGQPGLGSTFTIIIPK